MQDRKMIRITEIFEDEKSVKLKVDGKLVGSSIPLLKEQSMKHKTNNKKTVLLDFSDVSYIDKEGIKMLESIKDENLRIINCPLYIEALLRDLICLIKGD